MGKKYKDIEITDFNDDSEEVSKTQKKQMAAELRELAKLIAEMPKNKRTKLDLSESFIDAIDESQRITSHIARKRHFQFMGKLLIKMDHVKIQEQIQQLNNLDGHYQVRDEVINTWIENLTEHEKPLFEHLYDHYPHDQISVLRQTFRNYKKKPEQANNRKKLFQALRSLDQLIELPHPMSLV